MKSVLIPKVNALYPNSEVIRVCEFFIPQDRPVFSPILKHGWNIAPKSESPFVWQIEYCRNVGATNVNLEIIDENNKKRFADYKITEITFLAAAF